MLKISRPVLKIPRQVLRKYCYTNRYEYSGSMDQTAEFWIDNHLFAIRIVVLVIVPSGNAGSLTKVADQSALWRRDHAAVARRASISIAF